MSAKHTTNLTELAKFFPANQAKQQPTKVRGVASRFWKPGDTYEQALARQQESLERIKARAAIAKARGEA